jgi:hypothetical protein
MRMPAAVLPRRLGRKGAVLATEDRQQRQVDAVAAHVSGGGRHQLERDGTRRVIRSAGQQVRRHDRGGVELLLASTTSEARRYLS